MKRIDELLAHVRAEVSKQSGIPPRLLGACLTQTVQEALQDAEEGFVLSEEEEMRYVQAKEQLDEARETISRLRAKIAEMRAAGNVMSAQLEQGTYCTGDEMLATASALHDWQEATEE